MALNGFLSRHRYGSRYCHYFDIIDPGQDGRRQQKIIGTLNLSKTLLTIVSTDWKIDMSTINLASNDPRHRLAKASASSAKSAASIQRDMAEATPFAAIPAFQRLQHSGAGGSRLAWLALPASLAVLVAFVYATSQSGGQAGQQPPVAHEPVAAVQTTAPPAVMPAQATPAVALAPTATRAVPVASRSTAVPRAHRAAASAEPIPAAAPAAPMISAPAADAVQPSVSVQTAPAADPVIAAPVEPSAPTVDAAAPAAAQ